MKKTELQSIIREEIQNFINEAFSNWKVTFIRAIKNKNVGDVKKGHVEVVKARGTSEAIKKACDWAIENNVDYLFTPENALSGYLAESFNINT